MLQVLALIAAFFIVALFAAVIIGAVVICILAARATGPEAGNDD